MITWYRRRRCLKWLARADDCDAMANWATDANDEIVSSGGAPSEHLFDTYNHFLSRAIECHRKADRWCPGG